MSVQEITKASVIFKEEFERPYDPMVQRIWGELAKDAIEAVTEKIMALPVADPEDGKPDFHFKPGIPDPETGMPHPDFQKLNKVFQMQHIEAVLGIFIQRVYEKGKIDAGRDIANKVKTHIMSTLF